MITEPIRHNDSAVHSIFDPRECGVVTPMRQEQADIEAPVGLMVVHGIGNQRPGMLCTAMANRLADGTSANGLTQVDEVKNDTSTSRVFDEPMPMCRISVRGVPVYIVEANWAPLSHPDNPPRMRLAPYIIRNYLDTVGSAL